MRNNRSLKYRIISLFLSVVMVVTLLPATAFATGTEQTQEIAEPDVSEEEAVEAAVSEVELSEENAIVEESTENSTVFDLGNGKKTVVYYGQDVRFEEEGELIDYDPALVKVEDKTSAYKYENKAGDSKQYIPEKLEEDSQILMEKGEYSIKMLPLDPQIQNEKVTLRKEATLTAYETAELKNTVAVYETKNEKYSYEYTSLNQGLKESIVLNEKPDSNIFQFSLELEGMYAELNKDENTVFFIKKSENETEEKEIMAIIDRPFMNDATKEAYSEDLTYSLKKEAEGKYLLTLTVSKKYLNSVERVYPVTIDPTATWKGTEDFLDVYVRNGSSADTNFYDPDTRVMPAGVTTKGTYRTYFKLPNIKSRLADKYVDSAYLTVYETGNCDAGQLVRINRLIESWSVSTLTWNNKPSYYSSAYTNQFTTSGTQYKKHEISMTNTVRNYLNSNDHPNYGLVLRNINDNPDYAEFYGSRCAVSTYCPKVVITYYDKPTAPESLTVSRLTNDEYVKSSYVKKGSRIYANWTGIVSHNLELVQYKFVGVDGTAQPTSISSDEVDLTSYRSIGVASENGTNVGVSYSPSLPAGVYRLYVRGKDAAGMNGKARYKTVYVDETSPTLTNVAISPATTETNVTGNRQPTVTWNASDNYFSKITISIDGKTSKTVSTVAGNGEYTISPEEITTSGTHTIRVRAYDKAGHYTSKTLNYYVDVDAPDLTISMNPATTPTEAASNRTPTVSWNIEADDLAKVEVYLNDTKKYTTTNSSTTSYTFAQNNFGGTGAFKIKVKATDTRGNSAEKEITYFLDISAPVINSVTTNPVTSALNPSGNKSPILNWNITDTALESVSYSMDGITYHSMGNSKTGNYALPSSVWGEDSGKFTIYVKAKDVAGNECQPVEVKYYLGTSSDYVPKNLSSTEYYGKHYIRWTLDAYDPEKVAYDIHRGTGASFIPNDSTLLKENIDAVKGLYIDKEILENDTFYYKIVVRDISGDANAEDGCSAPLEVVNNITASQFANTMGQKDYLSYLDMGLPMGNLSVEESSGNLIYDQSEFAVSNAQLSYGLSRTYNSMNHRTSMMGLGWTDSWHMEIYTDGTDIYYVESDGSNYRFTVSDGVYTCAETKDYELSVTEDGYEIVTKDDKTLGFNHDGQLVSISEPNGCTIHYYYDNMGRLTYVVSKENSNGEKRLALNYAEDSYLLQSVEDFESTCYQYHYSEDKLVKVTIGETGQSGNEVSYHYIYNTDGLLAGIKDGMGYQYSVSYSNGKAASLSYSDGEKFKLTYGSGNTKIEKYTPQSQKIHEEIVRYDAATGKIIAFRDADGKSTSYEYVGGKPYLLARIKTVKGYQTIGTDNKIEFRETTNVVETEYAYDDNENIVLEETEEDISVYAYNEDDELINELTLLDDKNLMSFADDNICEVEVVQADGNAVRVSVNNTEYTYPEEQIITNIVNTYEDGKLIAVEDRVSNTTEQNGYDDDGNLTETTITEVTDSAITVNSSYDSQGNKENESSGDGNITVSSQAAYDSMGRMISSTENGVTTTTEYDYLGRNVRTTTTEAGKTTIVENKIYNANSTLTEESSPNGVTKKYTYDSRNRLIKTETTGTDIVRNEETLSYSYSTNVVGYNGKILYTEIAKDTAGNVVRTTYADSLGRTVREIDGTEITDYTYDSSGNSVVSRKWNEETSEEIIYVTLYDENGRSYAEVTNPQVTNGTYYISADSIVTYTSYDSRGNVQSETNPLGVVSSYTYDNEGRLVSTDIANDGVDISVTYSTLENGNELTRVTDANEGIKEEYLNTLGLTIQIADVADSSVETGSIVTSYVYDNLGRIEKESYADGSYVMYLYEGVSDRVEEKREFVRGSDENSTPESSTEYIYDSYNQVIGIVHKEGEEEVCEYTYAYDVSGRLVSETVSYDNESGKTTSYEYDAEGRLIKTTYPSSTSLGTVNYEYDQYGRLVNIKKGSALLRTYTYDSFNQVTTIKDYDKPGSSSYILKSYTYDIFGRTVSAVYTEDGNASKVLESYAYTYDKNDNILSENRVSNLSAEGSTINETRAYVYDSYGRLSQSTITDHTSGDVQTVTSYDYDAVGNRIRKVEDGEETLYTYNKFNQLLHADTPEAELVYDYDERGNQIIEKNETTGEVTETTYNIAGEMTQLVKKNGETTIFTQNNVYNQDGIRISRTQGTTEREYYYNSGVVAYTEDNNTLSSANIQNDDGAVIGTYRGSTYYNYLKNIQGSTESIISETGATAAVYSYSDFGETEEVSADSIGNEICYTGAIYDKDTGLYYMNARYYDAKNGRFISQDSYRGEIEDEGTWHLYAYCVNNPINYVDPTGHDAIVLKSNFVSEYVGHMAVLIRYNGNWRYFSWAGEGYKSKYMNSKANTEKYTVVKNGVVHSTINKRFKRNKESEKYKKYIYIKGDFTNCYSYIKKIKEGKTSYKYYSLTGVNCAWMAIQVLIQGKISETKRDKLKKIQYRKEYSEKKKKYVSVKNTIVPNNALNKIADIFSVPIKNVQY